MNIKEVTGKQPIPTIIINMLLENRFIDSADQVQVIDDWHYRVSDMRTWNKKEGLLTKRFQPALTEQGWNLEVDVQILPTENEDAIIDISRSKCTPYYILSCSGLDYCEEYYVSQDKNKIYLKAIENIFLYQDEDARKEQIMELLDEDNCEDISIIPVTSRVLVHDRMVFFIDLDRDDEQVVFLDPDDYGGDEWIALEEELNGEGNYVNSFEVI